MKGIYRKDLYQILASWPVLLLIAGIVTGLMIYVDAAVGISAFFPIYFAMQAATTIISDRSTGWTRMSTTFPITRKRLTESKYRLTMVSALLGFVLGMAIWALVSALKQKPLDLAGDDLQINLCIAAIITFCATGTLIPLAYMAKKGQEFITIFASFLLPAALVIFWSQNISSEVTMAGNDILSVNIDMQLPMLQGMAIFSLLLFVASYLIMPAILARRDQR